MSHRINYSFINGVQPACPYCYAFLIRLEWKHLGRHLASLSLIYRSNSGTQKYGGKNESLWETIGRI